MSNSHFDELKEEAEFIMWNTDRPVGHAVTDLGLRLAASQPVSRLSLVPTLQPLNATDHDLATAIEHLPPWCRLYACDSFLIQVTDGLVASALKFRGQGGGVVWRHLARQFLAESHPLSWIAGEIQRRRDKWLRPTPTVYEESEYDNCRLQYSALLGHKRCVGDIIAEQFSRSTGRQPTSHEWRKLFAEFRYFERRFLRANPQRTEADKKIERLRDNFLVHMWMDALIQGCDGVLLTSDRTVFEQFVTLCSIGGSHYYAWALSETVPVDIEAQLAPAPELETLGLSSSALRMRLSQFEIAGALPYNEWALNLQCWLIERTNCGWSLLPVAFRAECPMCHVLEVRGRTGGRNTDRLPFANIHFQWTVEGQTLMGELLACIDGALEIGSTDFPLDRSDFAGLRSLPALDVIRIQNSCDPIELPWHPVIRSG